MWNCILSAAGAAGNWLGDQLTDWTGLAAMRIPLEQAGNPGEVTLSR